MIRQAVWFPLLIAVRENTYVFQSFLRDIYN